MPAVTLRSVFQEEDKKDEVKEDAGFKKPESNRKGKEKTRKVSARKKDSKEK